MTAVSIRFGAYTVDERLNKIPSFTYRRMIFLLQEEFVGVADVFENDSLACEAALLD